MLRNIYRSSEATDGWYYQFIHIGGETYLSLSLDPDKPLIKLVVSNDTAEACRSKIVGAILAFSLEWEFYLEKLPEGIAVKQYLMRYQDDFERLSRNTIPLVTKIGPTYSLLMQSMEVSDNLSQNFTHKDDISHVPFVYALKQRLDNFIDNVWLVNNPIDQ